MAKDPVHSLVATKPFRYATRAYQAGDLIEKASARDARLLVAIGKARRVEGREPVDLAPPSAELRDRLAAFDHDGDGAPGGSASPPASEDLTALRRRYAEVVGRRPFNGWPADVLVEKIAAAGG